MISETTTVRQYGQLVIALNLPTQWRSMGGVQVRTRASGRSPWGRIKTLNSAI